MSCNVMSFLLGFRHVRLQKGSACPWVSAASRCGPDYQIDMMNVRVKA